MVPLPFLFVLMGLDFFIKLPLPAGVSVPAGAINPVAADEACLMRSVHTVPLRKQHDSFKDDADIFEDVVQLWKW